jgi:tetratricopeptide (TPR) repeat protein
MSHDRELETLKRKLSEAQRELAQAKGRFDKNKFRDLVNEIKLDLGWALLQRGEYEKGLAVYLSVLGKQYQERKYNGVGTALTEMGHYDEARNILTKGLVKFPRSSALWTDMGILYDHLGDYSQALRCFETAVRFTSEKNPGPLYNQALIMVKMGAYRDAASIIECLIEKYPEDPKYLAERGYCSLEMGYPQEALEYLQKAIGLFERFPSVDAGVSIYTGFCCAYMGLGMKKEAMEIALEGLTKFQDEDPILYHNAGATFYEMGWTEEARKVLQKGIEKFPDDEELKKFLNDVDEDLDDPDSHMKPRLLGLLLLALFHRRLKNKW